MVGSESQNEDVAPLKGARVLLAEDSVIVALDISYALEDAGATVIGPVARVDEALPIARNEDLEGVILDMHLEDGTASGVAVALLERRIPVIFCTGADLPPELNNRVPAEAVCIKPMRSGDLVEKLASLILSRR